MFFSYTPQQVEQNRMFYPNMYDSSHQLVQIDQAMNWYHLYEKLKSYYPKLFGRPSVDPIVLVKILMIQSLDGFRSVRFTCKQVQPNATYRWFLGISPFQKVPDHSTISKFLTKRLDGANFWLQLFNDQLSKIHQEGFLSHETWVADETELKANANKRKREVYNTEMIIKEDEGTLQLINQLRIRNGKKPLKPKEPKEIIKRTNRSPVDKDARLSVKHEKRGRFAYFEHRIVDSLHNFIIASEVTAANVPGHQVLPCSIGFLTESFWSLL